jgi:hypothetical protein
MERVIEFAVTRCYNFIQSVPGGKIHFLGGCSKDHAKQKVVYVRTYVCFVSNAFRDRAIHCTVPKLLIRKYFILILMPVFNVQVKNFVQFT